MFGLVSRAQLVMAAEVTTALRRDLKFEREEVKRLTNIIIQMRQQGYSMGPEAMDQRWPGGKYVMDEYEADAARDAPIRESEPEAPADPMEEMVMEKMLADDLIAAFPEETED